MKTSMQERKRAATLHVVDVDGKRLQGASVVVEQVSRDFPFGSAIANTILGNLPYQVRLLWAKNFPLLFVLFQIRICFKT